MTAATLDELISKAARLGRGRPWKGPRKVVCIRLSPDLIDGIKDAASSKGVAINTFITQELERAVERQSWTRVK